MAIAKKPQRNQSATSAPDADKAAQAFISGAGNGKTAPDEPESTTKKPVMIRFDPELLSRVDAAAKRRGISRSAWIQYTVSVSLDEEES